MALNFNAGAQMFYTRPSDGATYCFSPVPLLAESKEFLTTGDGAERLGIVHQVTFNGFLLATIPALSGISPDASCLEVLDRKSDQLCSALSEDFGSLLIVDASGYPVISERPRVVSLSFDESQMVSTRQYTLIFEYNSDFNDAKKVREFTETWNFNQLDDDTIAATHAINAVGISDPITGNTPFQNARDFVVARVSGSAGLPDKTNSSIMRVPFVDALIDIDGLTPFNHVFTENVDLTAGSYEINETWVLASGAFKDDRTVEKTFSLDETNNLVQTVNINGVVQGYGNTTFDKFTNALTGFNTFVSPQIGFTATSGITTKSTTENRFAGSVTYSLSRTPTDPDDQLESRSIQRSIERQEDGSVTQTVSTSASIRQGSASGIQLAIDFCFENNFPIDSAEPIFAASLSGNLVSVSSNRDEIANSFSLTKTFHDQSTALYREEVQVDRQESSDTSVTSVSIQGTVFGLGVETSTKDNTRFINASGAFFGPGGIEDLIPGRVAAITPTGSCIDSTPTTSTLSFSEFAGTIVYAKTFESRFKTTNENILKEEIEIGFDDPAEVIAVIPIPAKADGPILQDQQTVTGKTKNLNITYTMKRNTSMCGNTVVPNNLLLSTAIAESDILVDNTPTANARGEKPESTKVFKTQDQKGWNRQTLVFTRQIVWQYL